MTSHGFFNIAALDQQRAHANKRYLEFLRIPAMTAGVYTLPAGGTDSQQPHREDEMYYVVRGRARLRVAAEDQPVEEGSIIFVPAKAEHQFHNIEEDLVVLVFFAPAES